MPRERAPRRRILSVPAMPGVIGAGVFWLASLRPSLLPRDWYVQAGIGAICAAVGYGVGVLVGWVVSVVLQRPLDPPRRTQRLVAAVVVGVGLLALIPWWIWQQDQRELVDQEPEPGSLPTVLPMLLVASILFVILCLIGRVIGQGLMRLDGWLTKHVPRWVAFVVTALVFVTAIVVLSRDVVFDRFVSWANTTYSASDAETPSGVTRPQDATVSGSPDSLVGWDTLGGYGKAFVAQATTTDQLQSFFGSGTTVRPPIRVYAGLKSADSPDARAALVVQELERTGAADRAVVVAWTSTGTGWVDPVSAAAAEYVYRGDVAIASMQYSYLPSWISFLVDREKAQRAGEALNGAIYDWWSALPADDRPALLIFGESLGSMGTEAAFVGDDAAASVEAFTSRSDGVLLVGPTATNVIFEQIQDARADGSPIWAPVYDDGRVVRFMPRAGGVRPPGSSWDQPRILYVHHPSDPVGNWTMDTLWNPPAWIDHPTGDDVPDTVGWFPFVTWLQVVADLAAGFSSEPGHGHNYDADDVAAWTTVYAPTDGWDDADTARLQDLLGSVGEASS